MPPGIPCLITECGSAPKKFVDLFPVISSETSEIESYAAIWERAHTGLQQISSELKGKVVLVVTHSGTIRSIYWHLAHQLNFFVPYAHFKPKNGAYMIVSVKNGELTLRETNDINIIPPAS